MLIFEVSGWQEMALRSTRVRHQREAPPRQRWQPTGRVQLSGACPAGWVTCEPATKGSAQAFVVPGRRRAVVVNDNRKAAPWAALVREAAERAVAAALPPWPLEMGPVEVWITFYLPRPKAHYRGNGRGGRFLPKDAPGAPPTKPDGDKLQRCVWDALSGVVFKDDAQIVDGHVSKRYADPHLVGARIVVQRYQSSRATCDAHATPPGGA